MKISADFTVIPDDFAKPRPLNISMVACLWSPSRSTSMMWIPSPLPALGVRGPGFDSVCGFEWIHWSVANLPIDALMYDFNDSHALAIPPDFSRQLPAMIPETVQGRNSSASKFLGRSADPAVIMRYNGPQPPDKDHEYYLQVWATKKPLPGLNQASGSTSCCTRCATAVKCPTPTASS